MWFLAMTLVVEGVLEAAVGTTWAACAEPPGTASRDAGLPLGPVLTDDGSAQLLTTSGPTTCWWTVDDNGDATVSGRWEATPLAIAPLQDTGVVVVLQRPSGITLVVAPEPWAAARVGPELPQAPSRLLTSAGVSSFAVVFPEGEGFSRLWVVDANTGRLEANLLVSDRLDLQRWPELAVAVR